MIYVLVFIIFTLLLHEQWIPSILIVLFFKFTNSMPQGAIFTPFRTPIPAMSHLDLFGFNPEKIEKCSKICITSAAEFLVTGKKK